MVALKVKSYVIEEMLKQVNIFLYLKLLHIIGSNEVFFQTKSKGFSMLNPKTSTFSCRSWFHSTIFSIETIKAYAYQAIKKKKLQGISNSLILQKCSSRIE
jgi:hypothetical protein